MDRKELRKKGWQDEIDNDDCWSLPGEIDGLDFRQAVEVQQFIDHLKQKRPGSGQGGDADQSKSR